MRRERDAGRCAAWLSWPAAPAALPHGSNCWSINEFSANWTYHGGRLNIIRHNLSPLNESWLFYSTNKRGPFMRCNSMRNFFFPDETEEKRDNNDNSSNNNNNNNTQKKNLEKIQQKMGSCRPRGLSLFICPSKPHCTTLPSTPTPQLPTNNVN